MTRGYMPRFFYFPKVARNLPFPFIGEGLIFLYNLHRGERHGRIIRQRGLFTAGSEIMFVRYNANPVDNNVIDCTVRAICTLLDQDWVDTYIGLFVQGLKMYDMPSSNKVWMAYLREKGFIRKPILGNLTCDYDCYTVRDFCYDHPYGRYLLSVDGHVVVVIDGNYYDTWNSGRETVLYYFGKKDDT